MVARELTDDRGVPGIAPGHGQPAGELVRVRKIQGRRQRRPLAELVLSHDLGDFDDPGLVGLKIGEPDRAVACAEVDTETETGIHGVGSWLRVAGESAPGPRGRRTGPMPARSGRLFQFYLCRSDCRKPIGRAA